MRQTSVILAVAAFALGGLVGAYALLAERPLERGAAAGALQSGLERDAMAFPHGPVGQRQGVPLQGRPTAAPKSPSMFAPRSDSATAPPASPTTRNSTGSATTICSATSLPRSGPGGRSRSAWMKGRSRAFTRRRRASGWAVRAIDRVQRPLRCHRRDRSAGTRANSRDRAGGDGIPQQQDRAAMGRGYARALIRQAAPPASTAAISRLGYWPTWRPRPTCPPRP